jgi:maleate isomerase
MSVNIGVVTPHQAVGPEEELPAMGSGQVTTRVVRLVGDGSPAHRAVSPTSPSGLAALTDAVELSAAASQLATSDSDVVVYASTTTGYAIGNDAETAMVAQLARLTGLPAVATCTSTVHACHVLGVQRIALVGAPWFEPGMNELGAAYFNAAGLDVVGSESADLSLDPQAIEADDVADWVLHHVDSAAQAVFIGGNGFRVVHAVEAIEAGLDRPVLTSNQVLLWHALHHANASVDVDARFGRLFAVAP